MEGETDSTENRKKPQFGNRYLTEPDKVFQHNAWDDIEWPDELKRAAEERIKLNSKEVVPAEKQEKYEGEANIYWDKFYNIHQNRFFKDRHWLFTEFPELYVKPDSSKKDNESLQAENSAIPSRTTYIWEVGCGVGNTVFPIVQANLESDAFVYCCDFSEVAISIVQNHPDFNPSLCHPFVCDISANDWNVPFEEASLDIIILIFVVSAIHPDKIPNTLKTLAKYLRPGGQILFRDYGRYDMVELRFKAGQCLTDHFYVRGDGTRVYFFTEEEVHNLFENAGLVKMQNFTSRRLQVNRGKMLKMYRIWVQAKYMKPL